MRKKQNPIGIVGIYKITSPTNKIYIGQSIHIENRERDYRCLFCEKQRKIYNSIKKHGWNLHTFEIIQECEIELLNDLEIYFIAFFDTFNTPHGLNLTSGGHEKHFISEETRKKMSEAHKGRPGYWKGKTMSEEHRRKVGDAGKGRKKTEEQKIKNGLAIKNSEKFQTTMKSDGHRKKMSEAHKGRPSSKKGKPMSADSKMKMSEAKKGKYEGENNPMWGKKRPDLVEWIKANSDQFKGEGNHFYGKKHTEETRNRMSAAAKKRGMSPEATKRAYEVNKGSKRSPEAIEKMIATMKRNKELKQDGK